MRLPSLPAPERLRETLGRRGVALVLALAIELLIAIAFLYFLVPKLPERDRRIPTIFGFDVAADDKAAESPAPEKRETRTRRAVEKAEPRPTEPVVPEPEAEVPFPPGFIHMTRRQYAAADIGKIKGTAPDSKDSAEAGGSQPGDSATVGTGPNGEPLYAAEWYREPTNAELAPYVPQRARRPGWGLVACRTVANYRVEDCQELGQTPGSGYAGAVRQAAFQFRVRPPRKGGKPLIGAWVRIRIDYTTGRSEEGAN